MECFRNTRIQIEHKTHSTILTHLKINFNFLVQTRFRHYRRDPHSGTAPELIEGFPDSDFENFAAGNITFEDSLSYDGVGEAVEGAIAETPLLPHERRRVARLACKAVREMFPIGDTLPKCIIHYFDFTVMVEHAHVYTGALDYPRMIPAAESALGMLEKCDVGCAGEAERGCCICLEDLAGGEAAAARMPCNHVFHCGCIEEWLKTSHYCPLCRYEMPTE